MSLYRSLGLLTSKNSPTPLPSPVKSRISIDVTRNFTTAKHGQVLGRRWQSSSVCMFKQLITASHDHTRLKDRVARSPSAWRCSTPIVWVRRDYSSQSGSRTQDTTAQNNDSVNTTLTDNGVAGAKISERQRPIRLPVSGNAILDPDLTSQLVSHISQGITPPSPKYWDHRLLKSQDGETVPIHYCDCLKHTESVAQLFLNETLLGFDLEWQSQASKYSTIQENVSLIQLASRDRIALFHVSRFKPAANLEDLVSPTLKKILENPSITKAGVAISSDCTRLRRYLGIEVRGRFELSHLYKLVKYYDSNPALINKRLVSLTQQVEEHFGLPLSKDSNVRRSNWNFALTRNQIFYAATDAYAGCQLFHTMDAKRRALDPVPPLPAHAELNLPIRVARFHKTGVQMETAGARKTGFFGKYTADGLSSNAYAYYLLAFYASPTWNVAPDRLWKPS